MQKLLTAALILTLPAITLAQGTDPTDARAVKLLFDSWKLPIAPRTLIGNIHYVGSAGVSVFLITTPQGHFLIDTGFEENVIMAQKGIKQLGFKVSDIKYILSSHTHNDHTGGHASMKKLTGAAVVSSAEDARILESGGMEDFSPFIKEMMRYTPIKPDRIVADGDQVKLGDVTMTAHLTPGHTKGATTWTMQVKDGDKLLNVVFFSSTSISRGTKLVGNKDYPRITEDFEATYEKLKELPCDVWFAPHGGAFAMTNKFAQQDRTPSPNPFIDPDGWKRNLASQERTFREQLATERAAAKP